MGRVPDLQPQDMNDDQKRIADEIAGPRGGTVRGPFAIWLRTPEIADRANRLGNQLRREGKLETRLFELMVLVVARHWGAQYEWWVHEKHARDNGLSHDVIEAIRHHKVPVFAKQDEQLIYDVTRELCESRKLSDASYKRALDALGLEILIETISSAGFYTMVAMMLNAFDAPVPTGEQPLPA
jgi:4-carboxymuconolactone decarboxylase